MLFWDKTTNTITKTRITNGTLFTLRSADGKTRKQGIYANWTFTTTRDPKRHLMQKFNWYWLSLEVLHELQKDDKIVVRVKGKELRTTVSQREQFWMPRNYLGEKQLILPINLFTND